MKVTIENMIERTEFPAPGIRKQFVDVYYTTDRGYKGMITLEKPGLTTEKMKAAVKADAEHQHEMMGATFTV